MIKAIFLDFDGTLISHTTKQIPMSTIRSLEKARKKGIKIFLSTGRHLSELQSFSIEEIDFDGYITLNGQLVLDENKELLFSTPFNQTITDGLVSLFIERKIPLILIEEKNIYINFVNETVEQVQASISSEIPKIMSYDSLPIYMASTYLKRDEESQFESKLPKGCKLARWSEGGVDIISDQGGKVEGIKKVLDYFNISQNEIMAFGDAENDIDMIAFAKIGVAMGNGTNNVKKIADFVTTHIDDDGIEKALQHYSII